MPRFFSEQEYVDRVSRLQKSMQASDIEYLLVTSPEDIFYLSGHHTFGYYTFQALVVPDSGKPVLIARRGELVNGRHNSWLSTFIPYDDTNDPVEVTTATLKSFGRQTAKVGVDLDSWFLSPRTYQRITQHLNGFQVVDGGGLIGPLRIIKSPKEVEYIREAARIASVGMGAGVEAVRPGAYDHEVAGAILGAMMSNGCNYLAVEPVVAVGPRSGNMHSAHDNREIKTGDCVFLEIGGCFNRYHAGLLRTVYVGPKVPDEVSEWYEITKRVVDHVVSQTRPGATSSDVATTVANVPGVTEEYKKGRKRVGYSIGIAFAPDWGEGHLMDLKVGDSRPIRPGMTFHVPFAMRRTDAFGVGFSHTIHVTLNGAEALTSFPEELFVKP